MIAIIGAIYMSSGNKVTISLMLPWSRYIHNNIIWTFFVRLGWEGYSCSKVPLFAWQGNPWRRDNEIVSRGRITLSLIWSISVHPLNLFLQYFNGFLQHTVGPLYKGHLGTEFSDRCREVAR